MASSNLRKTRKSLQVTKKFLGRENLGSIA